MGERVRLIASSSNWIEGAAIEQLKRTAELAGVSDAVGLPDLHPGKGIPIGSAIYTQGLVYPHLVGNDVGCGMGLWQTEIKRNKVKIDKWHKRLSLEGSWQGDRRGFCAAHGLNEWSDALGTIGGGNHFAELQRVESVEDPLAAEALGLSAGYVHLMVHSGSRGLGQMVLRSHTDRLGASGLVAGSAESADYLRRHDEAVAFARANRALIARRVLEQVGSRGCCLADAPHNYVTRVGDGWLHRKGAAPADEPFALLPGSRGTFSYVLQPIRCERDHGWSLAHGAGRRWNRSSTKARLKGRYRAENLQKTRLGSRVVCTDRELLYEEAPEAYKNAKQVVDDMVAAGLVRVVAVMRPLLTYKVSGRPRR